MAVGERDARQALEVAGVVVEVADEEHARPGAAARAAGHSSARLSPVEIRVPALNWSVHGLCGGCGSTPGCVCCGNLEEALERRRAPRPASRAGAPGRRCRRRGSSRRVPPPRRSRSSVVAIRAYVSDEMLAETSRTTIPFAPCGRSTAPGLDPLGATRNASAARPTASPGCTAGATSASAARRGRAPDSRQARLRSCATSDGGFDVLGKCTDVGGLGIRRRPRDPRRFVGDLRAARVQRRRARRSPRRAGGRARAARQIRGADGARARARRRPAPEPGPFAGDAGRATRAAPQRRSVQPPRRPGRRLPRPARSASTAAEPRPGAGTPRGLPRRRSRAREG